MIKFLLVLKNGSSSANIFAEDHDAILNGQLVIYCESFDANNPHLAFLKRIPKQKNPDKKHIYHQLWHLPYADIVAVFEFDGESSPMGFSEK